MFRRLFVFLAMIAMCASVSRPAAALRKTAAEWAQPVRGPVPWHVILCQFPDSAAVAKANKISPQPLQDAKYYRDMFFTSGTQGMQDWVKTVSYGVASIDADVHGWYTESRTYEQAKARPTLAQISDCVGAAKNPPTGVGKQPDAFEPPTNDRVYVITSPGIDLRGVENLGAIGSDWWIHTAKNGTTYTTKATELREIAHEFGHGMGLVHSFNDDLTWKPPGWGAPGEYGNAWDIMSDRSAYSPGTTQFGAAPAGLNAHHLDELGWIPMNRVINVGEDGITTKEVKIAALTHPKADGVLMARVLFDQNNRWNYYTVEYRVADGVDAGMTGKGKFPSQMIQINEVQLESYYDPSTPKSPHNAYVTFLQRELGKYAGTGQGPPVQSLDKNGVKISVKHLYADYAVVDISTKFRQPCKEGYTWRDAGPDDNVCVTPQAKEQIADENRSGPKASADDKCPLGYFKRDAYQGDDVCVTKAQREQAQDQNTASDSLVLWDEYGPMTCQVGYVWRQADNSDYVCVTPDVRQQTWEQNSAAASHASGDECAASYVHRDAFPGDNVCVTEAQRDQVQSDNAAATSRVQRKVS